MSTWYARKTTTRIFDFDTEGIRMKVDGDWVRAEGTTLGADNGLGVATMLAIMESKNAPHPPLELLFTIDEETGMTGALELKQGWMKGEILLNLDTEDDREIGIGCAGGIDLGFSGQLATTAPAAEHGVLVEVKGGSGGHSGMDIHKGIANANKLLVRVLREMMLYRTVPPLLSFLHWTVADCAMPSPARPGRRWPVVFPQPSGPKSFMAWLPIFKLNTGQRTPPFPSHLKPLTHPVRFWPPQRETLCSPLWTSAPMALTA